MSTTEHLETPTSRVDGPKKVRGQAPYAAEFDAPGLLHGWVVNSTIARGKIRDIDTSAALALPGVVHVFTHENRPKTAWFDKKWKDADSPPGSPFRPLYDDEIVCSGQPIALVVADTLEQARHGAALVEVTYKEKKHHTDLDARRGKARKPKDPSGAKIPDTRGDVAAALKSADTTVEVEYHLNPEHHNPMEPHATTVVRDRDGSYRVYDKTQGVYNTLEYLENVFGLASDEVRVCSPFVGGGFGSGLRPQYQTFLAMMAAQTLERSVRVTLTRPQMFTLGYRPETIQKLRLGCDREGKLLALGHDVVANTSTFEDYVEMVTNWSGILYRCDNVEASHKVVELDLFTPLDMRAPGGCWGVHALECALDELAVTAGVDPVELRVRNFTDHDQVADKPFASKALKACYEQGAERFGWSRRNPEPRSMRNGHELVGYGMATGIWDAMQQKAQARATLSLDGKLVVASATSDIGTGTYTVMTQIAADALGLPLEDVVFELGDTALPRSPLQGGSWTVSTVGPAVRSAALAVGETILGHAKKIKKSPLKKAKMEDVSFADGRVFWTEDPERGVTFAEAMRAAGVTHVEETADTDPADDRDDYSHYAHSAVFAEVAVDEDFGTVSVRRLVNAVAAGRILNPKTAGSQILGGCVWGIGMALEEESMLDHNLGRFMNHDLAEYHVAVHADVHDVDVFFVDEHDEHVNSLGAKGVGEIGVVGVSAAIANAVYHATGKRVRELPITLDKLI